jgi:hypothetical protein
MIELIDKEEIDMQMTIILGRGESLGTFTIKRKDYVVVINRKFIKKDSPLYEIILLLKIAYFSDNINYFRKSVEYSEVKNIFALRENRLKKFFYNREDIENKFIELIEVNLLKGTSKELENKLLNEILTFVANLGTKSIMK